MQEGAEDDEEDDEEGVHDRIEAVALVEDVYRRSTPRSWPSQGGEVTMEEATGMDEFPCTAMTSALELAHDMLRESKARREDCQGKGTGARKAEAYS